MRKLLIKIAHYILSRTEKKSLIEKVNSLTKEPFVNDFFKKAMGEGNIDPDPVFVLVDGTEVYQTKVARASYEVLIMSATEIPRQYSEYGLRKERFFQFSELIRDELQTAKELIRIDALESQDVITRCQDILISLNSDFAFGDSLRQNLEMALCFLCTKSENPYVYDYESKSILLNKILNEKDRLIPFLYALPFMNALNISDSLQNDLAIASSQTVKEGAAAKLQQNSLRIIDLLNLRTKNQKFSWISQELEILTKLEQVNTENLPLMTT